MKTAFLGPKNFKKHLPPFTALQKFFQVHMISNESTGLAENHNKREQLAQLRE